MVKVSIIGSGNVAQHLISAFTNSPAAELVQIYARNPSSVSNLVSERQIVTELSALSDADLYIIAVSDNAIPEISKELKFSGRLVAHTAGSLPLSVIDRKNRAASFYPLQTFSKSKALNFREVPLCIESLNDADLAVVESAAKAISDHVFKVDTKQRLALHVAAVFVSNFANHMYSIGEDICAKNNLPFDMLKPLIAETALKAQLLSPAEAQTGPAKRNDTITISTHLEFLKDSKIAEIYNVITKSIKTWD